MHRLIPLLLLGSCAFEAPLAEDPRVGPAVISGSVVVSGPAAPATTAVLVYRADNPPPPAGTGRPIAFATVPADAFSQRAGLFEAFYEVSVPGVPSASVLVTALVDVDEDFFPLPPFSDVTAGATCGDYLGAHVADLTTGAFAPVEIAANERADGVAVIVARAAPFERPAFVFQGGSPILSREVAAEGGLQTFRIASTGVAAVAGGEPPLPLLDLAAPFDGSDPCGTSFWVTAYDRDGDGQPDPHPDFPPETGLIDAWPRAILQYLGEVDEQGRVTPTLEPGESWAMRAALFPDVVWFGAVPLNQPTPLTQAELIFVPAAQHTLADGTSEVVTDPTALPAGAWSLTLINIAGQTWTLPNALAGVGTSDPGRFTPQSQAGAVILE
jgi:hypothetical protein